MVGSVEDNLKTFLQVYPQEDEVDHLLSVQLDFSKSLSRCDQVEQGAG